MVLPPGHGQTLRAGRRLRPRERWMLGGVLGVVAALLILVVIALSVSGPSSAHGCIHIVVPAPTGAQELNQCGAAARASCESATRRGNFTAAAARLVVDACRKAELAAAR